MSTGLDITSETFQRIVRKIRGKVEQKDILKQASSGKLVDEAAQLAWFFIRANPSYIDAYCRLKTKLVTNEDVRNQFYISEIIDPAKDIIDPEFFYISAPPALLARSGPFKTTSVNSFCKRAVPEMRKHMAVFSERESQVEPLVIVINQTIKLERILSAVEKVLRKDEFKEHKLSRRFSRIGKELNQDSLIGAIICHYGKAQNLNHKKIESIYIRLLNTNQLSHSQCRARAKQFAKLADIAPWFFFSPTH
jgi:hypothetical protein